MEDKAYFRNLTDDECLYYFEQYKNGDKEAGDIIAGSNFKLVEYVVNTHFDIDKIKKDDLYSVGRMGLVKAMNSYDASKNIKFSTYATKCIYTELIHYYRKPQISAISVEDLYYQDIDGNKEPCYDFAIKSNENDFVEDFVNKDYVNYLLDILTDKERELIEKYFGIGKHSEPKSINIIASEHGVSRQYIAISITNILKDLKHCAENKNYAMTRKLRKNS